MTIAEKLQTIAENEPKVYEAGREKGYREGYTDATSGTAFETDSSIAYLKTVPIASENLAQVLKLGGMSYKTKNLIPFPYYHGKQTINGITWTVNSDGSIKAHGTATSDSTFYCIYDSTGYRQTILSGSYYFKALRSAGSYSTFYARVIAYDENLTSTNYTDLGSGTTITLNSNAQISVLIRVLSGATVSNLYFFPMLNEGSNELSYEPYFEGIRNAKVTELVSKGKNLFNPKQAVNANFVDNDDGTYTITNNGGNDRFSDYVDVHIPAGTTFTCKCTKTGDNPATTSLQFFATDGTADYTLFLSNNATKITLPKSIERLRVYVLTQDVGKSATLSNIQMEYGATATEYKPYIGTIAIKPIPEALRNFLEDKGYRLGINETYHNYIDYERKVFVPKVIEVTFDGSADENWSVGGNASQLMKINISVPAVNLAPCLANSLNGKTVGANTLAEGEFDVTTNAIYLRKEAVTNPNGTSGDVDKITNWRASLAENPLTVIYAVAEAIEIDISAYLTGDIIEVQGGGTIIPVNEFELAAPTAIQYIKKVGA